MNVDEQQLRLTLNQLFESKRGNELYPALLEMKTTPEVRWLADRSLPKHT